MENEVIETRTGKIWLREDGIIQIVCPPSVEITLEDAKNDIIHLDKVCKGKIYPLLIDMGSILSIAREARIHYTKSNEKYASAVALLVKSALSKMIGNFFIGLNKGDPPRKLFTSEADALEWLKGYLK